MSTTARTVIVSTLIALAMGGAFAQDVAPAATAVRPLPLRADDADRQLARDVLLIGTRSPLAVPVDGARAGDEGAGVHKKHHPRKEYPNVMGMSITEWLARHQ